MVAAESWHRAGACARACLDLATIDGDRQNVAARGASVKPWRQSMAGRCDTMKRINIYMMVI